MIGRLNHVGMAVPDLALARALYASTLGATVSAARDLPEHGVTVAFVSLPNAEIELLAPLGTSSPVRAFLDRNPTGGLHHVCFEVEDLEAARNRLAAEGTRVLGDGTARLGAHGLPVLFLHPKDACGVLIELQETPARARAPG